jgi:hypothetical protein
LGVVFREITVMIPSEMVQRNGLLTLHLFLQSAALQLKNIAHNAPLSYKIARKVRGT